MEYAYADHLISYQMQGFVSWTQQFATKIKCSQHYQQAKEYVTVTQVSLAT